MDNSVPRDAFRPMRARQNKSVLNNLESFTKPVAGTAMIYIGKTERRLHDRKTELFKALAKNDSTSAITDDVKTTGHLDILASGKSDYHCKIKETCLSKN